MARLLSALPTGLHFREIWWKDPCEKEIEGVMVLVEKCGDTLECIYLEAPFEAYGRPPLFSLCDRFDT